MSDAASNSSGHRKGAQPAIYIVDDEAMLLELATVILAPLGYQITTFRDPEQAQKAFSAARPPPALVITDYAMHRINGLALIEFCRKIQPRQKILLVSGTVGPEIFEHSSVRPDRFLNKPYQAKELVDIVQAMLAD